MMEKAGDGDQEGLLAALAGQEGIRDAWRRHAWNADEPAQEQTALRELVDSGQLTDDDKRSRRCSPSLGGGDVDAKIEDWRTRTGTGKPGAKARGRSTSLNKLMVTIGALILRLAPTRSVPVYPFAAQPLFDWRMAGTSQPTYAPLTLNT